MSIAEQSNAELNLLRRSSSENGDHYRRNSLTKRDISADTCRVCGDGNAKTHYGVITCFGCKGFFRRTLKRPTEYQCRHNGTCIVDRHERNSCRYCRFKKCIEVGMDPKAVRPDRDATGRHYQSRQRRSKLNAEDEGEVDSEWLRKLPVDMRTTLMQLMNIDLMVGSGDGSIDGKSIYPLPIDSVRRALEDPSILDGKRTEMRYESFREVDPSELPAEVHRRLLAVIDWVDHLCDIMDVQTLDDKIALVKHSFAPLMVFTYSAVTARTCKKEDVICLCNFGFVRRNCCTNWPEPYHFANHLAERSLDDLIRPFRKMNLKEEEIALLKAIIILNPHIKTLSTEASEAIADLRDRIHETLYHVVRETHPKEVASSRFGNLLLFLPSVMMLGTIVTENLQFVDSFGNMTDQLVHDLLREDPPGPVPDVSTERRMSEPQMSHSSSSSSLDSLHSYPSSSGSNYQANGMTYNFSSNSLPATVNNFEVSLNGTSSMPNLEQINDCDPDYNVTLTPDMFSDMRQAMSQSHAMDTSLALPEPRQSPTSPQADRRPTFYIESTKHKFAVTTFDTSYGYPPQAYGGMNEYQPPPPPPQQQQPPQPTPHVQSTPQMTQPPLSKSNSLPLQYCQFEPPTNAYGQPMEFDDNFY